MISLHGTLVVKIIK